MPDENPTHPLEYATAPQAGRNVFAAIGSVCALLEMIPLVLLLGDDSSMRKPVIIDWAVMGALAVICSLIGIYRARTSSSGGMARAITGLAVGAAGLGIGIILILFRKPF